MTTTFVYSEDSPLGGLYLRTAAALAEGRIPGCPHSAAAGHLRLHLRLGVLVCCECDAAMVTDPGPGECAACGGPDGRLWHGWYDEPSRVDVVARTCAGCMRAGNRSLAAG